MTEVRIPRRTIAALTAEAFGTSLPVLCGQTRNRKISQYRFAVWHLVRELRPNTSLAELGNLLEKDHTTAIHGLRRAKVLVSTDAEFAAGIERARKAIARWRPGSLVAPERVVSLVPVAKPAEPPSPVKYGAAIVSALRAERDEGSGYEIWRRMSCKNSEDLLFMKMREVHPEYVRVPVREAAE